MIEEQLRSGPLRVKLADAIRAVNAAHNETGGGENPDLSRAWLHLDKALQLAAVAGDQAAASKAIECYREEGIAASAHQLVRLARKDAAANGGAR